MPKTYNSKYFFGKIKKLQMIIRQMANYKSIDDMFLGKEKNIELSSVNQVQGREKWEI